MADPMQNMFSDMAEQPTPGPSPLEMIGDSKIERNGEDGDIVVTLDVAKQEEAALAEADEENLAVKLTDGERKAIAQEICAWVTADEQSRGQWKERMQNALELLGLKSMEAKDQVFKASSTVTHPLIAEACVQFQARAIAEIFPADGPVKTVISGVSTPQRIEQSQRVEDYMNFHLVEEDPGYYWDTDKMLFELPVSGSLFRKVFKDPISGQCIARYVKADDFVVPYSAKTLADAPRYTHKFTVPINDVKRAMAAGIYRDCELGGASQVIQTDGNERVTDVADDRTPSMAPDDDTRLFYECHCDYEMPWDADAPFAPPYICTVDKESQELLSVRRNYKKDDEKKQKKIWFIHYIYLPGLGFYGFGLLHLIGSLGTAATGALRALLDAAARANFPGGFKAKEARKAGEQAPGPGEWVDVDMTAEELNKSFFPLPYKEPSQSLMILLKDMVESGQRFSSTTEQMVGEAANTGPVGTTMALIEQGSKVFSAIHKRLHVALKDEFRLLKSLIREQMDEVYPYTVKGQSREIMRVDFDDTVDVIPVSDPSVASMTQRIALAQEVFKLVTGSPNIYDDTAQREAHRRLLEALKAQNIDALLPGRKMKRLDPVSENQLLMVGKPIAAYPEQDHLAHLASHQAVMQALPPELAKNLAPNMQAHLAEHYAYVYRAQIAQQTGPLPPMDLSQPIEDVSPEVDAAISHAVAQIHPHLQQLPGMQPAALPPEVEQQMQQMQQQLQAVSQQLQQAQQKEQQAEQAAQQAEMQVQQWQTGAASELMKLQSAKMDLQQQQQQLDMDRERAAHDITKQKLDTASGLDQQHTQLSAQLEQRQHDVDEATRALQQRTTDALNQIAQAESDLKLSLAQSQTATEKARSGVDKGISKLQLLADQVAMKEQAASDKQAKEKDKAKQQGSDEAGKQAQKIVTETLKPLEELMRILAAPKEVIRGADGRATGVRTVMPGSSTKQ